MAHKRIFTVLKRCCQLFAIIFFFGVIVRPVAMATEFSQVNLDDSDFLLLDVTLQQKRLLASIEAYQSDDQVLLPVNLLISSLGAGVEVDLATNTLIYTKENITTVIELSKSSASVPLPDGVYYWAKDDFELYLSHQILAPLLDASINVQLTRLNVIIKSTDNLFPIEKNWQRSEQLKREKSEDLKKIVYVKGTYQLFTPPSADISLSIGQQSETGFNGALNLQSSSDFLYHSTDLSLFKSLTDDQITSRLEFTRHQSAPDTPLLGGLNEYSFGDISNGGSALYSHSSTGLGFKFSRKPEGVSQSFGTQNIEGNATPGWEAELHYNGFLIDSTVVPDNGYYIFQNVETDYGNNYFEVRLFGPFGEEEVRRVNLNIGSNWLPKGEFSYTGYLLNSNKTLLDGDVDSIISHSKEDYGVTLDYSPFNNSHIGYFYQHVGSKTILNREQEARSYMGTHIQSALNNLLLDIEYVQQQDRGHRLTAQGLGQFPWGQNYNVVIREQRDFSTISNIYAPYNYQASFATSGVLPFERGIGHRTGITYTGAKDGGNSWLLNSSLSWRFSDFHFSETLNYRINNIDSIDDSLIGNFTVSSTIASISLRATANYLLMPVSYLSSIDLGASLRASQNSYHNLSANYQPESKFKEEDAWRMGYTYSTTLEKFRWYTNLDFDSEDHWLLGLGINFFFDYDAYNDKFIMSSNNSAKAGHLNITNYLDRNDNNRRDEGDWLLDNVAYDPLPAWQGRVTNHSGQIRLSGVPVYTPVTFTAAPDIDVATKQPNYTIYTHPGSRVNIEIPFTIKTNVIGFVEIETNNGLQPLTTGSMVLINRNTDERTELRIDIDGFYETPDLNAGHYSLQVANSDLERLKLLAAQGTINFVTPAQGGDYELPVITLVKASENIPTEESTTVILNEENGEAFYYGDDIKANNIYVNPWQPAIAINGDSAQATEKSAPNYQKDAAQPLAILPPSSASNEMMRAESLGNATTTSALLIAPSAIASDAAMQAEAAGNFSLPAPQVESTPINQPQPQVVSNPQATQLYTVQVGAFSSLDNAQKWQQDNQPVASACTISNSNKLYLVGCGRFASRSAAASYQQQLAQQYGIDSTMIKALNTAPSDNTVVQSANSVAYTIQLLAVSQQSTIDAFVVRHRLDQTQVNITEKVSNGKVLKVLSYGRYSSKPVAQQAISTLPAAVQQQTWVTQL